MEGIQIVDDEGGGPARHGISYERRDVDDDTVPVQSHEAGIAIRFVRSVRKPAPETELLAVEPLGVLRAGDVKDRDSAYEQFQLLSGPLA